MLIEIYAECRVKVEPRTGLARRADIHAWTNVDSFLAPSTLIKIDSFVRAVSSIRFRLREGPYKCPTYCRSDANTAIDHEVPSVAVGQSRRVFSHFRVTFNPFVRNLPRIVSRATLGGRFTDVHVCDSESHRRPAERRRVKRHCWSRGGGGFAGAYIVVAYVYAWDVYARACARACATSRKGEMYSRRRM